MIKEALPLLKQSKKANILLTSSMGGQDPFEYIGVYGLTKAGIENMVKFLSKELMEFNIRINCIAPGFVRTNMSEGFIKDNPLINEKNCAEPE